MTRYRTADGSCNHPGDGRYGMAITPLNRLLPPQYADGIDQPRRSVSGEELPSTRYMKNLSTHHNILVQLVQIWPIGCQPISETESCCIPTCRLLSTSLTSDSSHLDHRHTVLVMALGQFITHDLSHSPIMKNGDEDIDCCRSQREGTTRSLLLYLSSRSSQRSRRIYFCTDIFG